MSGQSSIIKTTPISGTTATWFPANTSITGTVSSESTKVTGVGTTFTTQFSEGDWMINASNEAQKVFKIESDTILQLEKQFSSNLSGATVTKIKDKVLKYLKIVFLTSAGSVQGAQQSSDGIAAGAWPANIPWDTPSYDDFIDPQLVTPGAGANVIQGQ